MAQFRTRRAPVDGILLIDKPAGCTSHDVVARVRRMLRPGVKSVGHAGTLDPFATGLLLIVLALVMFILEAKFPTHGVLGVGGTGTVSATGGGSGNAVTFSSTTTGVCTVSGSTVSGVSAGKSTTNFMPTAQSRMWWPSGKPKTSSSWRPMGPMGPSPITVSAAWMSMPGVKPSEGFPFLSTP